MQDTIEWNDKLKLIISDVDETIADVYTPAEPAMIQELTALLEEGLAIFFVTGAGLERVESGIIDHIAAHLRSQILVSHCSGAEVWGYDDTGERRAEPWYSLYEDSLTEQQQRDWREAVDQLIEEFQLEIYPTTDVATFKKNVGDNPLAVMKEDRGPQITLEVVNGYELTPEQSKELTKRIPAIDEANDLRTPMLERADELFTANNVPITPRFGGVFALDFALKGVSKTDTVKYLFKDAAMRESIGLTKDEIKDPKNLEIWGDKFNQFQGGTDRHICEAVDPAVRAIDFRDEDPAGFLPGYNIVIWPGEKHLHHGLLEYLQQRN